MAEVNPTATDLLAWYSFDEASASDNAIEEMGNATTLYRRSGDIAITTGVVDGAREMTGAYGDGFNAGSTEEHTMGDTNMSIGIWLYITDFRTDIFNIFGNYNPYNDESEYLLTVNNSTRLVLWNLYNGSDANLVGTITGADALPLNSWALIVVFHDADNNLAGINISSGTTSTAATSGSPGDFFLTNTALEVGDVQDFERLSAKMDNLVFFRKRLSDDEIEWLYNSGSGRAYTELTGLGPPNIKTVNGISDWKTFNGIPKGSVNSMQGIT